MPVRPLCAVLGADLHPAIGLTPVGVPLPALTTWISAAPTWYGSGDDPVPDVFICGEKAIRKGTDSKYLRMHATVINIGPPPPAITVPPVMDFGLALVVIGFGCSKPLWGPTSVRAGGKSIAVIMIPLLPAATGNQLICSDPCDLPLGAALEMPTTVYAGMTLEDYALCLASLAVDMAVSFALNVITAGFGDVAKPFKNGAVAAEKAAAKEAEKKFAEAAAKQGAEKASQEAAKEMAKEGAKSAANETQKKAANDAASPAWDPDSQLGFGAAKQTK